MHDTHKEWLARCLTFRWVILPNVRAQANAKELRPLRHLSGVHFKDPALLWATPHGHARRRGYVADSRHLQHGVDLARLRPWTRGQLNADRADAR
jgi:hypothetical protein